MSTDFYDLDSVLSEEERAVRDTIRAFVDEKVLPIIGDCYIEGRFPKELVPEMAQLGMFGANLPEEYGCAGLNNVATLLLPAQSYSSGRVTPNIPSYAIL